MSISNPNTMTAAPTKITMVEALNQAMDQEMARDKSVVCFGEDTGFEGGVFRVTAGLQKKHGVERCFDTPLAEIGIIGCGIGMALAGLRPIAEIQFLGFLFPGFQQLISHAARYRKRSQGRHSVPMVIRTPYGGGVHALEHHSESFEAIFAHTPGLKCVMPSSPYEAKGLMVAAIRDPDPVILLEPTRLYRSVREEVPAELYEIPIGQANIVNKGFDITVVAWGAMLHETKPVIAKLANENISVELIDLRSVAPIDFPTIFESVKKTGRLCIVQEGPKTCGIASEISAMCNERMMLHLKAPIMRVTGFDVMMPLLQTEHYYMPTAARIERGIRDVLEF